MVTFTEEHDRLTEADVFPSVLPPARSAYIPYAQAQQAWGLVRRNQPWDPKNPSEKYAGLLRADVADALLGLDGDWAEVEMYSTTESALDYHFGDGWIEWNGRTVLLDFSERPEKVEDGCYKEALVVPPTIKNPAVRAELARAIAAEFRYQGEAAQAQPR